jgi:N-acetylglucosaminyldiphosphoundecaprenol N-acetyl-beta-D-mannosaminyltransferase
MKENILGYPVDTSSITSCVSDIYSFIAKSAKRWFACINPHSYAVALRDPSFSKALLAADWLVPDGIGVVYASRWLGGHIRERVTGSDVFFGLSERMNTDGGMSVFFLGSSEETLTKIRARMAYDYPNIRIVGSLSPPFKPFYTDEEICEMIDSVNSVSPDVLWVGLTAPKQEKWIAENIHRLDIKFAGAIGAVFDFYTGKIKRSHPLFQKLGLEWLPRLIQEPRRLWSRMFVSAPIFVWHVIRQRFKGHIN